MKDCPKSFAVYSITALAVAFLLVFSPLTSDQMDYIYRHMSNYQKEEVQRFAEVFKALSNPNRLHIFLRLVSCCPPGTKCISDAAVQRCVGELGQGLEIDPSTVSHHLKELRRSGLIRMERRGKNMLCWVDPETVLAVANLLTGYSLTIRENESISVGVYK